MYSKPYCTEPWFAHFSYSHSAFKEFVQHFKETLDRKVCWADRMEFINSWYILLIISDILTITGSVMKVGIESKVCPAYCHLIQTQYLLQYFL